MIVNDDPGNPVIDSIAHDDGMLEQNAPLDEARKHYFATGKSALRCIRQALAAVEKPEVQRILDFPCGHGRVLRMLKAAWPNASLHACDLLTEGMEFCKSSFGATPITSDPNPKKIKLRGPYDLIWVGSLFTHLNANLWQDFLALLHSSLGDGGVCVVTTHGKWAAELIRRGETGYGLKDPGRLLDPFDASGFAYESYSSADNYGISLSSLPWVTQQVTRLKNSRVCSIIERGWSNHQDVIAWQKVTW